MKPNPKPDPYPIPKLPLFSMVANLSEPSGTLTPPLHTAASIPFRWEEHPGKPLPCTDITIVSTTPTTPPNKHLNLPPRLALVEPNVIIKTSSPSPTTVLDGPGDVLTKSLFSSSSFRFATERCRRKWSFDSDGGGGDGWSPDGDNGGGRQLLLLGGKIDRRNGGGLFGSFRSFRLTGDRKSKGSFVISRSSSSSSMSAGFFEEMNGKKMRRNSSVSKVIRLKLWPKIYEGFKQVVPWRKKHKIERFTL